MTAIQTVAQLNLADNLQALGLCRQHVRAVAGNTRREHNLLAALQQLVKSTLADFHTAARSSQRLL